MTDDPDLETSMSFLRRVSENDAGSWARFTRIYGPLVYKWCQNSGLKNEDSADIGQNVFQVVFEKFPTFEAGRKPVGGFRSWLWGITRYEILNFRRRNKRQPVGAGGSTAQLQWQQIQIPEKEPQDLFGQSPEQLLLKAAVSELQSEFSPRTWQAFWELAVAGRGAKQIGEELGMSAVAVRQARFRVSRKLSKLLGDDVSLLRNAAAENS